LRARSASRNENGERGRDDSQTLKHHPSLFLSDETAEQVSGDAP
jgi:hypothetical protein